MDIWICLSWGMLVVGVVGLIVSYVCDKTSIAMNCFIIVGSLETIVFYSKYPQTIKIYLGSILVCILLCWISIWRRSTKRNKKKVIRAKIKKSISAASCIMGAFLGCFMITLPMIFLGEKMLVRAKTKPVREEVVVTYGDEYSFRENADVIANFQEEKWRKLDKDKRLETAQRVAHCEARYWGIWTPLTVVVKDLDSENIAGRYNDQSYTIFIDEEHFMNSEAKEVLETICHEAYHAYSFRMIDLYKQTSGEMKHLQIFRDAEQYLGEFEHYIDGTINPLGYYLQECEKDARDYAKAAAKEYYALIKEYLVEKG